MVLGVASSKEMVSETSGCVGLCESVSKDMVSEASGGAVTDISQTSETETANGIS